MYGCVELIKSSHSMQFLCIGNHQHPRTDLPPRWCHSNHLHLCWWSWLKLHCAYLLWSAGAVELSALCVQGADPHLARGRNYDVLLYHERQHSSAHVGFLRHNYTKFDIYNIALIQVVDVIMTDNSDISSRVKFHCFWGWAYVVIIGMTKYCCS